MPEYDGLPLRHRLPKKKLSHISEGRESIMTHSTARRSRGLDEASVAEHDRQTNRSQRFYDGSDRSLPSVTQNTAETRRHGHESRGDGGSGLGGSNQRSGERSSMTPHLSSTPHLSDSNGTSRRRSSGSEHNPDTTTRPSIESTRPSLEGFRPSFDSSAGPSARPDSVRSGVSWVPDLPTPEQMATRRRRRSSEMLGGSNAARQRVWEGREILDSVDEATSPYIKALARGTKDDRLGAFLDEQARRAPLDAHRRIVAHAERRASADAGSAPLAGSPVA